ncbi:thioesterase family protein [Nocardioides terrisoli]|uniref:thioesterase family protein n=1 Tax=Nocardioides terrisoli TaxID=3388267 RepID=UPI00287BA873|nr:thioesterase [Nocardioides marmorisolisilvae]
MPIESGLSASAVFTVTDDDTAAALGSGSLAVLGTPRLLAWCEAVTCAALAPELTPGTTSVGTRVDLEHLAASPVGAAVAISATASYVDLPTGSGRRGALVRFTVTATDAAAGKLVGSGQVTRVVVDTERFLARVG